MKIRSSEGKRKVDTVITEFFLFCLFVRLRFLGLMEFRESVLLIFLFLCRRLCRLTMLLFSVEFKL